MANPFLREDVVVNQSVATIVRDTANVNADGSVSFRASMGKGSGRAIILSAEEFPEFVKAINYIAEERERIAAIESDKLTVVNETEVDSQES